MQEFTVIFHKKDKGDGVLNEINSKPYGKN